MSTEVYCNSSYQRRTFTPPYVSHVTAVVIEAGPAPTSITFTKHVERKISNSKCCSSTVSFVAVRPCEGPLESPGTRTEQTGLTAQLKRTGTGGLVGSLSVASMDEHTYFSCCSKVLVQNSEVILQVNLDCMHVYASTMNISIGHHTLTLSFCTRTRLSA